MSMPAPRRILHAADSVRTAAAPSAANHDPAAADHKPTIATRGPADGCWLRPLSGNWPLAVCQLLAAGEPAVVRIVVAEIRGSTPREPGTCMLVSHDGTRGTIGGGCLEWRAMEAARDLLTAKAKPSVQVRRLVLGTELGQCCGGTVQLWLDRFTRTDLPLLRKAADAVAADMPVLLATDRSGNHVARRLLRSDSPEARKELQVNRHRAGFRASNDQQASLLERLDAAAPVLWLYGAGHVGQALVRVLGGLPFETTWVDSRAELLPNGLARGVRALHAQMPLNTVSIAPRGARYLIMTHDHALDYELCRAILACGDFDWLGLIGSKSKAARFRSRLARDGIAPETLARLVCPIGVPGIASKLPAAIAIAVAAQLLQHLGNTEVASAVATPVSATAPIPAAISATESATAPIPTAVSATVSAAVPAEDQQCASRDCTTCRSAKASPS